MNIHLRRFLLIAIVTLGGILATVPPREKLKLGIDLSGGTILVYEVKRGSSTDFKMDDLIASLKRRVNPEGIQDIPIRKVGGNRVEVILPQADANKVDDIKRMITDVGQLEFRILANEKHDGGPGRHRQGHVPQRAEEPARRLPMGRPGRARRRRESRVHRHDPEGSGASLGAKSVLGTHVRRADRQGFRRPGRDHRRGHRQERREHAHRRPSRAFRPETYDPQERPRYINIKSLKSYFKTIASYKIDYNPGRIRATRTTSSASSRAARGSSNATSW